MLKRNETILEETRDEPRLFWREIDQDLRIGKPKSTVAYCERIRNVNGSIVTGNEVLLEFNKFYVNGS